MTRRTGLAASAILGVLPLLAACSSGPAEPGNGEYRAFAAAAGLPGAPGASVAISDGAAEVTADGATSRSALTERSLDQVLCPPDAKGSAWTLDAGIVIGGIAFEEPAIIGDCGTSAPVRITLVDLASGSESVRPFPFTRWIEFCDVSDPDCPVP